jgi:CRP-like cAMP-binding protein
MESNSSITDILGSIPWFTELNREQRNRIERISKRLSVSASEYIFLEGDKEDYVYILLQGQLAIVMMVPGQEELCVHLAQPNEIIGWSSVTPIIRQRTASARALTPSQLLAIDSVKLREFCDEDHDMGYLIMRRLVNVVATRLLLTRLQLVEIITNLSTQ